MGRGTFSGAQNENLFAETDRLPSLKMHVLQKRTKKLNFQCIFNTNMIQKHEKIKEFQDLAQIETDENETWHTFRLFVYLSVCQVSASSVSIRARS